MENEDPPITVQELVQFVVRRGDILNTILVDLTVKNSALALLTSEFALTPSVFLLMLTNLGIPIEHVTWARVTLTSDAYLCVRSAKEALDKRHTDDQILVIDLQSEGCQQTSLTYKSESAIMCPQTDNKSQPKLAIKLEDSLVVLELIEKNANTLCSCTVEDVHLWTWINSHALGIVVEDDVLHWDFKQGTMPQKVFERHQRLEYTEIIGYKVDPKQKWFALTGLLPQAESIVGVTQLHSVENDVTQCISAHTVTFCEYQFEGNSQESTTLCVAARDPDNSSQGKVHIIELGPHLPGNFAPSSHTETIKFVEDEEKYDFPVAIHVSVKFGLVYMVTKYGYLYLFDMETASCLCSTIVATEVIFTSTLNNLTQGIIAVCKSGKILSIDIRTDQLLSHIKKNLKKPGVASRLQKVLPAVQLEYLL